MKRCPECYEVYENTERFCEADGQRLLADPALDIIYEEDATSDPGMQGGREQWLTGSIGVMIGIVLCAGVYVTYSMWAIQSGSDVQHTPAVVSHIQEPARPNRAAAAPTPELNQEAEEGPSPQDEAKPESTVSPAPVPETQTVAARLNQGPVSTGQATKDDEQAARLRTIIQMKDGTSVEVDAAWEDRQGIWYRRGGLVSFVESERVKAITARSEPKASPATSQ